MDQNRATQFFGFLNKTNGRSDDILLNNILNVILGPFVCQEINTSQLGTIFAVLTGTIDYMGDLVHLEPLYILLMINESTCAMYSSAMKIPSQILVGMESSY